MRSRPCPCGSGLSSSWNYDARGIELCRSCDECHEVKMAQYPTEILKNPNYAVDEPIEEDKW